MQGYFFWRINVNYIIFDLEWNNAYCYAAKKAVNEIIEIGAVKLDHRLKVVDTFKQLIKPSISKKLSSHFSNLTNITLEEIKENGIPFSDAFRAFSSWARGEDNVFLSWSNSDLYVLQQNYLQFFGISNIPFLTNYCDAQKYCMAFIDDSVQSPNQQISLSNCANIFEIDFDSSNLHRALTDCYLTAACLEKVYDCEKMKEYTSVCDDGFFQRLLFKPYFLSRPITEYCNLYQMDYTCPNCGNNLSVENDFQFKNNVFTSVFSCASCKEKFWGYVRVKKMYDDVKINKRFVRVSKRNKKYTED